jgi:hypothetical protein
MTFLGFKIAKLVILGLLAGAWGDVAEQVCVQPAAHA